MKIAHFRFDSDLRELLRHSHEIGELEYGFTGPQSVKHLVESIGIPHTEVGAIRANEVPVDSSYLVQDGDSIDVAGNAPATNTDREPRFVLDGHLGRLNARLRMLGLDCLYAANDDDTALLQLALSQVRILLTRDRRLLMHKALTTGYLVRSQYADVQLREVVNRYALRGWIRPFQRCLRCNGLLKPIAKADVVERLEPLTKRYFDEFRLCPECNQIYWKGSHFERMLRMIATLE